MKKKEMKEKYIAPAIEVIKMENEGIIATSVGNYNPGSGGAFPTTRGGTRTTSRNVHQSGSFLDDLQDIFDLTVKK